jgi:plasmid stabilization system protein ParE
MKLSEEDVGLFYKLHQALLLYTNQRKGIVSGVTTVEEFMQLPIEEIGKIRESLYGQFRLVDSFVKENPFNFSQEELEIVKSWKDFLKDRFFLFRHLKKYAIFLDDSSPPKAYGVLALKSDFLDMAGGQRLPIFLEAVLLPFKGQIIHDGILIPYPVSFGPGIRRDLKEEYQEAKARFGIITSLPWGEKEESDIEQLKSYLSSEAMREKYWKEIEKLIKKDSSLLTFYHQEMGKIHARTSGRRLSKIGLRGAWFAILEGEIVAGGSTRAEVEQILGGIIPKEKRNFVYVFRLRGK